MKKQLLQLVKKVVNYKTLIILSVVATSCSKNEENATPSKAALTDQTEEAFFGRTGTLSSGTFLGNQVEFMVIDNHKVFEGDIIITDEQLENLPHSNQRVEGTGRTKASVKWPNKTVYYTIDPALPNQARVTDAIAHWQTNTLMKFVKRTNQANYITFRPGAGCSSSVGMVGGRQYINLATGCSTGNTIHEIGHAIGLWHEHTRADRNNHVKVNFNNIEAGKEHNFKTYIERGVDGFDHLSLDFGSIMMYGSYSFSKNGSPTITKLNGATYSVQRNALSTNDKLCVQKMYP